MVINVSVLSITMATISKLDSTREDKGKMIIAEAEMTAISDLRPIHCNKTIEAVAYRISGFSREQTGLWERTLDNPTSLIFQFCFLQRVPARTNVNHTILTDVQGDTKRWQSNNDTDGKDVIELLTLTNNPDGAIYDHAYYGPQVLVSSPM
ncbi:hypothetical protein Tco_1204004 [Tanacetum coccineum]